jgi:hypothetical protein
MNLKKLRADFRGVKWTKWTSSSGPYYCGVHGAQFYVVWRKLSTTDCKWIVDLVSKYAQTQREYECFASEWHQLQRILP